MRPRFRSSTCATTVAWPASCSASRTRSSTSGLVLKIATIFRSAGSATSPSVRVARLFRHCAGRLPSARGGARGAPRRRENPRAGCPAPPRAVRPRLLPCGRGRSPLAPLGSRLSDRAGGGSQPSHLRGARGGRRVGSGGREAAPRGGGSAPARTVVRVGDRSGVAVGGLRGRGAAAARLPPRVGGSASSLVQGHGGGRVRGRPAPLPSRRGDDRARRRAERRPRRGAVPAARDRRVAHGGQ